MQNIVFTIVANSDNAKDALKSLQSEIKVVQKNLTDTEQKGKDGMDGIAKGTKKAGEEVGKFQNSLKSLIAPMAAAFSVAALVSFAKEARKVREEMEQYEILLKSIYGTEQDAMEAQKSLTKMAQLHGLEIKNLTRMYTGFMGPAKSLGIEVGKADRIFKNLTLGIKASGGSMQDVEATMSGLIKQLAKGELTAFAFEGRFAKSMPNAMEWFSTSLGVTQNELRKMLDAGQVTIDMLDGFAQAAADSGINELADQSASAASETIRLENAWTALYNTIGDSRGASAGVNVITGVVDGLRLTYDALVYSIAMFRKWSGDPSLLNELKSESAMNAMSEANIRLKESAESSAKTFVNSMKDAMKYNAVVAHLARDSEKGLISESEKTKQLSALKGRLVKIIEQEIGANKSQLITGSDLNDAEKKHNDRLNANNVALGTQLDMYKATSSAKSKSQKEIEGEIKALVELEAMRRRAMLAAEDEIGKIQLKAQFEIKDLKQDPAFNRLKTREEQDAIILEIAKTAQSKIDAIRDKEERDIVKSNEEKLKIHESFLKDKEAQDRHAEKYAEKIEKEKREVARQEYEDFKATELEKKNLRIDIAMQSFDLLATLGQNYANAQVRQLDEQLQKGVISQEAYEAQIRKIKRKEAIMNKAGALFQIGINTAIGVSSPANLAALGALSPLIIALGALQAATVIAKPIPYNKGTKRVPMMRGAVRGQDSVHAILTPDERVVPADINNQQGYSALMDLAQDKKISNEEAGFIAKLATSGMGRSSQGSIDYDELGRSIAKHIPHTDVRIDDNGIAIITERRTGEINRLKSRL